MDRLHLSPGTAIARRQHELLAAVGVADTIVLAAPLYFDSPPYPVILAKEILARNRQAAAGPSGQRLLAISNCGYPEAHHNQTALEIYRRFAREAGLIWLGALALGGGEAINDQPLPSLGGLTRNVRRSLELAAEALAAGRPVPPDAAALMARPLAPYCPAAAGWGPVAPALPAAGRTSAA